MLSYLSRYCLPATGILGRFFYLSDVNLNNWDYSYTWGIDYSNSYAGYLIDRYSNSNVTWEVAKKTNYGLELGLFNDLTIQADYFTEHRSNIYMSRDYIPSTMGLTTTISSNLGEVKSNGIDLSMDYNKAFNSGLIISGRGNFTYATNEVLINGEPDYTYDYLSRIGHPVNQAWGLVACDLLIIF